MGKTVGHPRAQRHHPADLRASAQTVAQPAWRPPRTRWSLRQAEGACRARPRPKSAQKLPDHSQQPLKYPPATATKTASSQMEACLASTAARPNVAPRSMPSKCTDQMRGQERDKGAEGWGSHAAGRDESPCARRWPGRRGLRAHKDDAPQLRARHGVLPHSGQGGGIAAREGGVRCWPQHGRLAERAGRTDTAVSAQKMASHRAEI